jgi:hypothetical protein
MVVAAITRESVREAFKMGITASQVMHIFKSSLKKKLVYFIF